MSEADTTGKAAVFTNDRLPLVTKVAKLYHESRLRQPEISERLNLSQSRVSRLLKQAVSEKYGLIDAAIAEPMVDDEPSLLGALGSVAGGYLESTLTEHERLGISSWSS